MDLAQAGDANGEKSSHISDLLPLGGTKGTHAVGLRIHGTRPKTAVREIKSRLQGVHSSKADSTPGELPTTNVCSGYTESGTEIRASIYNISPRELGRTNSATRCTTARSGRMAECSDYRTETQ